MEVCCTFRSIAIAWGACGALSSHFNIALFVKGHLYLGLGHTGILGAIIPNSGYSCSVSVTSTYKYKIIRYHCHLSKHFMQRSEFGGKPRVRSAECGKWGMWKMRNVENTECGKCGVWKVRSVENFNIPFQFQFSISISGEMWRKSVLTIKKKTRWIIAF